jgi:hypothetical protein
MMDDWLAQNDGPIPGDVWERIEREYWQRIEQQLNVSRLA